MFLEILFGCLLVALGLFAIPNLFASKKKELTTFFKKLLLYQGWIGLAACIVGIMAFIQYVPKGATTDMTPFLWLTMLLCSAGLAILGFFLSYNLIYNYFLSKGEKVKEAKEAKPEEEIPTEETQDKMRTQIMPLQGRIGILAILIGIWSIMAAVMFA